MTLYVFNCLVEVDHLAAQPADHLEHLVLKVLVRDPQVNLYVKIFCGERALAALVLDLHVVLQDVLLNTVEISITLTKLALAKNQKVFAEVGLRAVHDQVSVRGLNVTLLSAAVVVDARVTFWTKSGATANPAVLAFNVVL